MPGPSQPDSTAQPLPAPAAVNSYTLQQPIHSQTVGLNGMPSVVQYSQKDGIGKSDLEAVPGVPPQSSQVGYYMNAPCLTA